MAITAKQRSSQAELSAVFDSVKKLSGEADKEIERFKFPAKSMKEYGPLTTEISCDAGLPLAKTRYHLTKLWSAGAIQKHLAYRGCIAQWYFVADGQAIDLADLFAKKKSLKQTRSGVSFPRTYALLIDGHKYFIRHVDVHTETRFEGTYKGSNITVWLDEDDYQAEECRYYIMVNNPHVSFGTSYDGWAPEWIDNLEDAVKEALRGSCLLKSRVAPTNSPND